MLFFNILRLPFIGRLLPGLAVAALRGASSSTAASRATTIRTIAIMFDALEQDSNLIFVLLSFVGEISSNRTDK